MEALSKVDIWIVLDKFVRCVQECISTDLIDSKQREGLENLNSWDVHAATHFQGGKIFSLLFVLDAG